MLVNTLLGMAIDVRTARPTVLGSGPPAAACRGRPSGRWPSAPCTTAGCVPRRRHRRRRRGDPRRRRRGDAAGRRRRRRGGHGDVPRPAGAGPGAGRARRWCRWHDVATSLLVGAVHDDRSAWADRSCARAQNRRVAPRASRRPRLACSTAGPRRRTVAPMPTRLASGSRRARGSRSSLRAIHPGAGTRRATMTVDDPRDRLALALDVDDLVVALRLAHRLRPWFGVAKVGLELFGAAGPEAVSALTVEGYRVFLDLKLHDIPTTVARAARVIGGLGVSYTTVHTPGARPWCGPRCSGMAEGAMRRPGPQHPACSGSPSSPATPTRAPEVLAVPGERWRPRPAAGDSCAPPRDLAVTRAGRPRAPDRGSRDPAVGGRGRRPGPCRRPRPPPSAAGADILVIGRAVTAAGDPEATAAAVARRSGGRRSPPGADDPRSRGRYGGPHAATSCTYPGAAPGGAGQGRQGPPRAGRGEGEAQDGVHHPVGAPHDEPRRTRPSAR